VRDLLVAGLQEKRRNISGQRWDEDRADRLLDAALVVLEAAGGWETPDHVEDPRAFFG